MKYNLNLTEIPASVLSQISGGADKPKPQPQPQPKPDNPPPKQPDDTIKPYLWIWD